MNLDYIYIIHITLMTSHVYQEYRLENKSNFHLRFSSLQSFKTAICDKYITLISYWLYYQFFSR